ncbi:MAG: M28 family peptidase [Bacteroidales bacterium]|nr:M28 family peptidase [Bacteroidales bacterium]
MKSSLICYSGEDFSILISETPVCIAELDSQWDTQKAYFLIRTSSNYINSEWMEYCRDQSEILYHQGADVIIKMDPVRVANFKLPYQSTRIALQPRTWEISMPLFQILDFTVDTFPEIFNYVSEVDTNKIMDAIQHLQDYGTRYCLDTNAVHAQNWIKEKMEGLGLSVELQDFPLWSLDPSDNVIASYPGTVLPDEYVIVGAHYDSYASGNNAPGADDNASGTSGVLEIARILSQYDFEKTLIFCAFSAEEMGLVGSDAYVNRCKNQGMNILGYFNLDMIGYRAPGNGLFTDMIYPSTATPLANFYKGTTALYVEDFPTNTGFLSGGDSDHTSFNNYGYQGIFPFEDDHGYSPFIHSAADTIGKSVNSPELAVKFVQSSLAAAACLAIPVQNVGIANQNTKKLVKILSNPSGKNIRFTYTGPKAMYSVYSINGQLISSASLSGPGNYTINITYPGVYILQTRSDKSFTTDKIIVQ